MLVRTLAKGTEIIHWGVGTRTRNLHASTAMTLLIVSFALTPGAAKAQSYTGHWPATVSMSQHANGPYCITLHDDGSFGWPHSGEAQLVPSEGTDNGSFQVINGILTVSFPQPGGTAEIGALIFTAPARNGQIGSKGSYEQFYGSVIDSGLLTFGARDTCPFGQ
jgi:hypothetical protein